MAPTRLALLALLALLAAPALVRAAAVPAAKDPLTKDPVATEAPAPVTDPTLATTIIADPNDAIDKPAPVPLRCCIDHPLKPLTPAAVANFDCSQLVPFGADRCKAVYGGGVCKWATGAECLQIQPRPCTRVSKYEVHYGQRVDVGECRGACDAADSADGSRPACKPKTTSPMQLNGGVVLVVKECECSNCAAQPQNIAIEVPAGVCKGKCATAQLSRTCTAGVADNFSPANGAEPSSPSVALLSGPLGSCSAGVQPGFDFFADNRCFGHTFSDCLVRGPCPLKSAIVKFCIRAANVPLTSTDGLALGTNGVFHWGIALPTLNGGTWNKGETLCTSLDLSNLPNGGANILPQLDVAGELDFFVQDDTAVDFVTLAVEYVNCQVCAPKVSVVSTLYAPGGPQNFEDVKDCACVDGTKCHREPLFQTFFPGTIFQATLDVGQCIGRCNTAVPSKCRPTAATKKELKAPEGIRIVEIIEKCDCF
jgi:hypothetical protein